MWVPIISFIFIIIIIIFELFLLTPPFYAQENYVREALGSPLLHHANLPPDAVSIR